MSDKDFNIKVSVRNARLLRAIREKYESVAEFCRDADLSQQRVGALIGFRVPPTKVNGEWTRVALDVAAALGQYPADLWPKHFERAQAKRTTAEIEASREDVAALAAPESDPVRSALQRKMLASWAGTLTPRELQAITMRQEGLTYAEVGQSLNVCVARARQIEAKGFRKMRQRARAQGIKSYLEAAE